MRNQDASGINLYLLRVEPKSRCAVPQKSINIHRRSSFTSKNINVQNKSGPFQGKKYRDLAYLLFLLQDSKCAGPCLFLSQNLALCGSGLSPLNTMVHMPRSKAPSRTELSQSCSHCQL